MIIISAELTFPNGEIYEVDYRNLKSLDFEIMDRKDTSLPCWGIISNGGSIKIIDYNGAINNIASTNGLNGDTKIKIFLKNTSNSYSEQAADMIVSDWKYDNDNKIFTGTITDGLERMQNINATSLPLSTRPDADYRVRMYASASYRTLANMTLEKGFDIMTFDELDSITQYFLTHYSFFQYYSEQVSLWSAWQEFCEVLQLYMYKNKNGKIVCVYKEGK